MKVKFSNIEKTLRKYQTGGEVPPQEAPTDNGAPAQEAPAEGQDPLMQLVQASMQALQAQDCNLAMQVCQALVQMAQGAAQGPEQPQGEPVYRKGGTLLKRVKKN